jgi:hypothetical protein
MKNWGENAIQSWKGSPQKKVGKSSVLKVKARQR